uniref:Venom protein n=1 Tax=Hemiscolopendra marginata TaxID=943146 RepID=A0A646QF81_9MYRI
MSLLILATILALGVINIEASDVASNQAICPDIQSDSVEGIEGRWFRVYSNMKYHNVKCAYGDIVNLGHDEFVSTVILDLVEGGSDNITSTIKKEADGKYYDFWVDEEGVLHRDLTMMKLDGDFLLTWICIDLGNGRVGEHASIHSKTHKLSNAVVVKYDNWLKERGSQGGHFYETRLDECSAQ